MGQNATFSAPARCSSTRRRLLRLGEATCLQLALSSFTSAKDRFSLANPRVVLAGCSPFILAKICFTSTKVFFAFANARPSIYLVFSFASVKLSLRLGELHHLSKAMLMGRFCFLALFSLFFACFTFYFYKT